MTLATTTSRSLLGAAVKSSAGIGAVIGGTVATVQDVNRVHTGEMTKAEAVADVGKEAVGTGLSTAAGVAVIGALGIGGVLGLVGIVGVAVGTKHLWDKQFGYTPNKKAIAE